MNKPIEIENIEEMRRQEGIEDVELRHEIRALKTGDFVKLTFLTGARAMGGETLLVRITSVKGFTFRGKLEEQPASSSLASLHVGSPLVFTAAHIHSVAKRLTSHEQ